MSSKKSAEDESSSYTSGQTSKSHQSSDNGSESASNSNNSQKSENNKSEKSDRSSVAGDDKESTSERNLNKISKSNRPTTYKVHEDEKEIGDNMSDTSYRTEQKSVRFNNKIEEQEFDESKSERESGFNKSLIDSSKKSSKSGNNLSRSGQPPQHKGILKSQNVDIPKRKTEESKNKDRDHSDDSDGASSSESMKTKAHKSEKVDSDSDQSKNDHSVNPDQVSEKSSQRESKLSHSKDGSVKSSNQDSSQDHRSDRNTSQNVDQLDQNKNINSIPESSNEDESIIYDNSSIQNDDVSALEGKDYDSNEIINIAKNLSKFILRKGLEEVNRYLYGLLSKLNMVIQMPDFLQNMIVVGDENNYFYGLEDDSAEFNKYNIKVLLLSQSQFKKHIDEFVGKNYLNKSKNKDSKILVRIFVLQHKGNSTRGFPLIFIIFEELNYFSYIIDWENISPYLLDSTFTNEFSINSLIFRSIDKMSDQNFQNMITLFQKMYGEFKTINQHFIDEALFECESYSDKLVDLVNIFKDHYK